MEDNFELKCGKAIGIFHSSPGYEERIKIDIYSSDSNSAFNVELEIDMEERDKIVKALMNL